MTYHMLLSVLTAQKQPMIVQFGLPVKPRPIVFREPASSSGCLWVPVRAFLSPAV